PVDGEDDADRRIEEDEIAVVLGAHAVDLTPLDSERIVESPADRAAALKVGFEELVGIVLVFVPLGLLGADARLQDRLRQAFLDLATRDVGLPGLHVGDRKSTRLNSSHVK